MADIMQNRKLNRMSVQINQNYPGFVRTLSIERKKGLPGRPGNVAYMIIVEVDADTQVNVSFGPIAGDDDDN
jgi:hypothetical protein